jgi:hypothetical protein
MGLSNIGTYPSRGCAKAATEASLHVFCVYKIHFSIVLPYTYDPIDISWRVQITERLAIQESTVALSQAAAWTCNNFPVVIA